MNKIEIGLLLVSTVLILPAILLVIIEKFKEWRKRWKIVQH
jgi:hypothetical protein